MIAAQGVQLGGETGQARLVVFQAILDEVDVFGGIGLAFRLEWQKGLDDVLGDPRAHQAREVGLDAIAQPAQGIGAAFVIGQQQVGQGALDFLLRGLGAQRLGQLGREVLGRAGRQFAALRTADVVHRAGLGGALLFFAGFGEQRDQGEHQHVNGQRGHGGEVPVAGADAIAEDADVQRIDVGHQRHEHCSGTTGPGRIAGRR